MRENKFRGQRKDIGEWVYGYYDGCYETTTINYLKNGIPYNVRVTPETVGQYTGLHDATKWEDLPNAERKEFFNKNRSEDGKTIKYQKLEDVKHLWKGREIYEGDILQAHDFPKDRLTFSVTWCEYGGFNLLGINTSAFKVIGNVHENPEITKGKG